jgi:hypothetical protein
MESTTYELGPLLAEIRDRFRGMRAIRACLRAARRAPRAAIFSPGQQGDSSPGTRLPNTAPQDSARPRALPSR